jgi:hypothetical protein
MIGFVLGTGCCGSSLVHEILARHPDVGFVSNVDDRLHRLGVRGRLNRPVYARVPQSWTQKGRLRFAPSEGYRALQSEVAPVVAFPGRRLGSIDVSSSVVDDFRTFFERRWKVQQTESFLHKFTGASRVGLIARAFPEARYVHIVRDGRAVANSFMKQAWWTGPGGMGATWRANLSEQHREVLQAEGNPSVLLSGLAWLQMIEDHEADREAVSPEVWLEIRYEDVVAAPVVAFGRMLSHLKLAPSAQFNEALASYRLSSARTDGFRSELDGEQMALLDRHLGGQLGRMGYP